MYLRFGRVKFLFWFWYRVIEVVLVGMDVCGFWRVWDEERVGYFCGDLFGGRAMDEVI